MSVANIRAAQKQASRLAIVEAAMRLIRDGGIAAVSHRSVAREAGVSPALVTYHFANIDGLLAASRNHAMQIGANRLAAAVDAAREGKTDLIEVAAEYLSNVILNRADEFIVTLEFDLAVARNSPPSCAPSHARDSYIGLIRPYVASEQIANSIFSAVFGYAFQGRLGLNSGELPDCRAFIADLFRRYDVTVLPQPPEDKP